MLFRSVGGRNNLFSIYNQMQGSRGSRTARSRNQLNNNRYQINQINQVHQARLSYYNMNKNNKTALLDTVNFYGGEVSADSNRNGYFTFGGDGRGQMIPKSAIPRINLNTIGKLQAKKNTLALKTNTYYAFKSSDNRSYACAFDGLEIKRAYSEEILADDKRWLSESSRKYMTNTMTIVSDLAQGKLNDIANMDKEQVKKCLKSVGITEGKFTIQVNGKARDYVLAEDGGITKA